MSKNRIVKTAGPAAEKVWSVFLDTVALSLFRPEKRENNRKEPGGRQKFDFLFLTEYNFIDQHYVLFVSSPKQLSLAGRAFGFTEGSSSFLF